MKTKILILTLVLVAVLLTASTPMKGQVITGTLQWTRSSICGYQDYIYSRSYITSSADQIYLTGLGFPTRGENAGCSIRAEGYSIKQDFCRVFYVTSSTLACTVSTISR